MKYLKNVEQFNEEFLNERVSYGELQNIVKDYLNKEIQFTLTGDIKTYVKGTIDNIDYHSNGKGFEIGIKNYISGDGVKDGTGSMSIYPNEDEDKVIFSHKDYKPHPVASDDTFTLDFFDFMKKIDFTK